MSGPTRYEQHFCVRDREKAAPTFQCTPSKLDQQGAKKVHSGEGRGRLISHYATCRKRCYLSFAWQMKFLADNGSLYTRAKISYEIFQDK